MNILKLHTRIKLWAVSAAMLLTVPLVAAPAAYALSPQLAADSVGDACSGIGLAGGACTNNGSGISKVIKNIINILSIVVGVVAVVMIIVGGLRYITSGGETSKVAGAKNTIIYAIVGLIIVAMAQFIVHFVLHTAGAD